MRLLHVRDFIFTDFPDDNKPAYIAASHRWHGKDEATFQDIRDNRNTDSRGYQKVQAFVTYIEEKMTSVEWLWIDTCCINKDSAAELSEAINLMFDWYRDAELCLAYLADVETVEKVEDKGSFEKSEWFRRGWTLQELLAPRMVVFVTQSWQVIGHKAGIACNSRGFDVGHSLTERIARTTGIPEHVLRDYNTSANLSVDDKLKWIEGRTTTRPEDMSYALYGIVGVTLGANYGEKYDGARQRLLTAIRQQESLAMQQASQFEEIARWLSMPDPWTSHKLARQRHEPHTGAWLLDCAEYHNWKFAATQHLWLYGKAGCGKTILCSTAIEDVRSYCETRTRTGCAIFYFSFSDDRKMQQKHLLLSLVTQLGWKEPGLSMLRQAYKKQTINGSDALEKIAFACIKSYDTLFLLVDALDECPEDGDARQEMLTWLARLTQTAPQLRILATSRELPDIRESMVRLGAKPVSIATQSVDADIRRYVTTQLSLDHRLSRLDRKTKLLIEETMSNKADGMFRWAYCQLQELKKLKSTKPKFVQEALYALPSTLDETYERMLLMIEEGLRPEALTLLRWLAYTRSPPSLGELVDATVIDLTGDGSVDTDNRGGLDDTLEILSGLIVIDGAEEDDELLVNARQQISNGTKVRLAHFSVKEFLESKRILEGDAKDFHLESGREHGILSQSCITYIIHYSRSKVELSAEDLRTFFLLRYAATSWFYHSSLKDAAESTWELDLLCNEATLRYWLQVHEPDRLGKKKFETPEDIGSGLYYASVVGLEHVVSELLGARAEVNAQGGYYGNALEAASYGGHEKVVQMLIDAGAYVDAQERNYGNALEAASFIGSEKVVQILIDAGADVNAQGGNYSNALGAASSGAHEKIVQMLIDAGADVNAQGGYYGNALGLASNGGHEKIVQMLIDAGAKINAQGGNYSNALGAASYRGSEKVVQMLIDAGADVNAQGGHYSNALGAASNEGHEKIVQMLIDAGADVNAYKEGYYGNALGAASYGGSEKVVQMLIDAGANVNARGGHYSNALGAASNEGHEKIVQMLIDAGANVNAQGGRYSNALGAASYRGSEKVVQMLIDAGANVNAQGGYYGNALGAASHGGREKIVQMLIDAGADVNAQGGYYGNALGLASNGGHEKIVQMLIDAGADVNAQGGHYSNALGAASHGGHKTVVQMLVDAGAHVNA